MNVSRLGLVVNVALIGLKLLGGFVGRSQALIADAVHSTSDLFSDVVVLLGLKWGRKRADRNHPYGHGRIETIASLMVGLLLILAALSIVYQAMAAFYEHRDSAPSLLAVVVAAVSIAAKEAMYWYTIRVGRRIRSLVLIGNAWHHRTDAFSSVAVLLGLIAAHINPDWHLADPVAALVVSLFVFQAGIPLVRKSVSELADTAPDQSVLAELKTQAALVPGVMQVHGLKARQSGPRLLVEMHVVVDRSITVHDGHEIADKVQARLLDQMEAVGEVLVHIEPDSVLRTDSRSDDFGL